MSDEKGTYNYVVLARISDVDGTAGGGTYARIGDTWQGRTPEEAIETAARAHGMPEEIGGEVVAIPARRFHVRRAQRTMEPTWEISTLVDAEVVEDEPPARDPGKPSSTV